MLDVGGLNKVNVAASLLENCSDAEQTIILAYNLNRRRHYG
ncbi:TPA: hypothetical protein ACT9K3_000652 [Legionella pneumophila]|nr:hypothetical protein [Legionella gratiana]